VLTKLIFYGMVLKKLYIFLHIVMRVLSYFPCLFLFLFLPSALAEEEDPWKEVSRSLDSGEEVVLLPLQSEIPLDLQEQPPTPQLELHFSGAQVENTSVAQAMLAIPAIPVGEQGIVSPFFSLKGQSDGTREGQTFSVEGGVSLSIGERSQIQLSVETMVSPFPSTSIQGNVVFKF
jgi:hypothetical protein